MGGRASLLLELGTEELPPRALPQLGRDLAFGLRDSLREARLLDADAAAPQWFAAPRRLAALVPGVRARQESRATERRGPLQSAAFDRDGKPTAAAIGFARSCGVAVDALATVGEGEAARLVHRATRPGEDLAALAPQCIAKALRALPVPKRMRWGAGEAEFVRPVHWVLLLHGATVIPARILSVPSGGTTRGHRVHADRAITVKNADDYAEVLLSKGKVIADFAARKKRIAEQVAAIAKKENAAAQLDEDLLEEVTGLVEWPQAVAGAIDAEFMEVPAEALVCSMRDHQKYFPLRDGDGKLLPRFVLVSNIESATAAGMENVRRGNERVLRARLADARFFWDSDRKTKLAERAARLSGIVFHQKLGTIADKSGRISNLARALAPAFGADKKTVARAAQLAKADLVTAMVGEFPSLQGIMGRRYALADGEPQAVAEAVAEHYLPRFAGDDLPRSAAGEALAVADRLDTLGGIFFAGDVPSGDKDPYSLRRAALGVLRILIENGHGFDLLPWLERAVAQHDKTAAKKTARQVLDFILERLRAYSIARGFATAEFLAVRAAAAQNPLDFYRRLEAVAEFRKLPAAQNLAAANKRIANILQQAKVKTAGAVDKNLLREDAEKNLFAALGKIHTAVKKDFAAARYVEVLARAAELQVPVDAFFDRVMVMTDDVALRKNRLALLAEVRALCNSVADISRLAAG